MNQLWLLTIGKFKNGRLSKATVLIFMGTGRQGLGLDFLMSLRLKKISPLF